MSITEENSISRTLYKGKICERHPDLLGTRIKASYTCVTCQYERNKANRQTEPGKKSHNAQEYERRLNDRVVKKNRAQIHTMVRLRAVEIAMKNGNARYWNDHYTEALDQLRAEGKVPS